MVMNVSTINVLVTLGSSVTGLKLQSRLKDLPSIVDLKRSYQSERNPTKSDRTVL